MFAILTQKANFRDMDKYTVVRMANSLVEAEMMVSLLKAHGVEAHFPDRYMLSGQPHLAHVMGGIRIMVPTEQLDQANTVINEAQRELKVVRDIPELTEDEPIASPRPMPRSWVKPGGRWVSWALLALVILLFALSFLEF